MLRKGSLKKKSGLYKIRTHDLQLFAFDPGTKAIPQRYESKIFQVADLRFNVWALLFLTDHSPRPRRS